MLDPAGVCGAPGEAVSHFPPSSDALRDGKEVKWPDAMYPDLHMPFAPSWSLHWAYRDGHLVNLPVSLLVEGDIIALRPGQESFASLRGIKVAGGSSPSLEIVGTSTSSGGRVPGLNPDACCPARGFPGKRSRKKRRKPGTSFSSSCSSFSVILKLLGNPSPRLFPPYPR